MDSSSRKFREMQNIQLSDTIVAIASSHEYIAVATLDDSIALWYCCPLHSGIIAFHHSRKNLPISGEPSPLG